MKAQLSQKSDLHHAAEAKGQQRRDRLWIKDGPPEDPQMTRPTDRRTIRLVSRVRR